MTRPQFIVAVTLSLVGAPLSAEAQQQPGKVHRIGVLTVSPAARDHALREALREFGYVEGINLTIDWRSASGDGNKVRRLRR